MKNSDNTKRLLNVSEASQYLGISIPIFYKLVNAGKIEQVSIGVKSKRYDLKDLDIFISKNKQQVKQKSA